MPDPARWRFAAAAAPLVAFVPRFAAAASAPVAMLAQQRWLEPRSTRRTSRPDLFQVTRQVTSK
jgi:hypothetical protein